MQISDTDNAGLLSRGHAMLRHNKRYVVWFYLLNLTLASFGTAAFRNQVHPILDHSLNSGRLVHGFDLAVFIELMARPELGPLRASTMSAMYFVFLFFAMTALFLPGVFQGFACNYRLPREEFFRACGRNLWRFVRLLVLSGLSMIIAASLLFGAQTALVKRAGESTNELLPFETRTIMLAIIFLVMTTLRIAFDLAEVNTVLDEQRVVRRSIGWGFRHTFRNLATVLGGYVLISVVAGIVLMGGLWVWVKFVAPENVVGAFLVGQATLFLLLVARFWQRGVAVAYWQRQVLAPVAVSDIAMAQPAPVPDLAAPVVSPVIPSGHVSES